MAVGDWRLAIGGHEPKANSQAPIAIL